MQCCYSECPLAECHYSESPYAAYAECPYSKCCGTAETNWQIHMYNSVLLKGHI